MTGGALRVFLSSTFVDMQRERDVLTRRVFPGLRARCEDRGGLLTEIDLRWGITTEQAERGLIISTCLAEIEACRPLFIGVIGDRYGTVLPPSAVDLEHYPWLADLADRSLLEVELRHGVLHATAGAGLVLVRIPRPVDDDHRLDRFICELRGACELRTYRDDSELAGHVEAYLGRAIDVALPRDDSGAARSHRTHDAYIAVRSAHLVDRPAMRRVLDDHVMGRGPPLVITGPPGAGKTALLMDWLTRARRGETGPRAWWRRKWSRDGSDTIWAVHAAGADPSAATWRDAIVHLLETLSPDDRSAPTEQEEARARFAGVLAAVPTGRRLIVVLDAPDQLELDAGGDALEWIPRTLAPTVRLVLTAGPAAAARLAERGVHRLDLPPLGHVERRAIVNRYLASFAKTLPNSLIDAIVAAPAAGNPLYLRLLLQEARLFGSHGHLPIEIGRLVAVENVAGLFGIILDRLQDDFAESPVLLPKALGFLAASRVGLTEMEMRTLLDSGRHPVPWATWTTLRLALGDAVTLQGGYLRLASPALVDVVRARYLHGQAGQAAHRSLATFFDRYVPSVERTVAELPDHLIALDDVHALRALLVDPTRLQAAWRTRDLAVEAWWRRVGAAGLGSPVAAYRAASAPPEFVRTAALLLRRAGEPSAARALWERLLALGPGDATTALTGDLGNLAAALRAEGRLDDAEGVLRRQETACRRVSDAAGLQACLGNLALLAAERGDFERADALHLEESALCSAAHLPADYGRSLIHRARVRVLQVRAGASESRHRLHEANRLLDEGERACRHGGDGRGLLTAAGVRGAILHERGDLRSARRVLDLQWRNYEQLGDRRAIVTALGELAAVEMELGDFDAAQGRIDALHGLAESTADPRVLGWAEYLDATLRFNLGDRGGAERRGVDALRLCADNHSFELRRQVKRLLQQLGVDGLVR